MMLVTWTPRAAQALGQGVDDGGADAAADADGVAGVDEFGGSAQRTGDVADGLADLHDAQVAAGLAHGLDDERDGARRRVGVGDGQGDALGALAPAHDDELARAGAPRRCGWPR